MSRAQVLPAVHTDPAQHRWFSAPQLSAGSQTPSWHTPPEQHSADVAQSPPTSTQQCPALHPNSAQQSSWSTHSAPATPQHTPWSHTSVRLHARPAQHCCRLPPQRAVTTTSGAGMSGVTTAASLTVTIWPELHPTAASSARATKRDARPSMTAQHART